MKRIIFSLLVLLGLHVPGFAALTIEDKAAKTMPSKSAANVRGDINGDGEVSMQDVMFLMNYILNGNFPDEGEEELVFTGRNEVVVGGNFTYYATVSYQIIRDSEKNTMTVIVPEYELPGTAIGNLVIGECTIEDIPYVEERGAYYKEYADGKLSMHFKSSSGMDNDYIFNNNTITTSIEIKLNGTTADIVDNYSIGNMPMSICTTFSGNQE